MGNAEWGMGQLDDYYNGGLECIVDPIPNSPFAISLSYRSGGSLTRG